MTDTKQIKTSDGKSIEYFPTPIGYLRNQWRGRMVEVFSIPETSALVLTIGTPLTGGDKIVCLESASLYTRVIDMFPDVCVYE